MKQGDSLVWRMVDGEWNTSAIALINVSPMGQGIVMLRSTFINSGIDFKPRSIISGDIVQPFENDIVAAVHDIDDLRAAWSGSMESLTRVTLIMIAAAIILSTVVLYNLGLLSFTEKERELATLKVLGFKSGKLRRLLLMQNMWLSITGILLGIPLGSWLNGKIVTMIGDRFDLIAMYSPLSLGFCVAFVLIISVATNLIFSNRLKTLDMVQAFKSVD
jgi:putative ABC transport system permease protein